MTAHVYADPSKSIPDWLPGVKRIQGSDAGPMMPGSKWSLLLHTTEGDSLQGAISALRGKSAWSHFIFDPKTNELVQAVSMNRAAKSLRSGGNFGRTNAARVIQVEIVGHAHEAPFWGAEVNSNIGKMIRRIAESVPFVVEMPLPFYGDRSGFTVASESAKQRMSWANWYKFNAICGHQHSPKNEHWDPGEIQVGQILSVAQAGDLPPARVVWVAPKFPGYTLREGQRGANVAVLKMLLVAGGYGDDLDMSKDKVTVFGAGTRLAVQKAMVDYYAMHHKPGRVSAGAVGLTTWNWLCDVVANIKAHQK